MNQLLMAVFGLTAIAMAMGGNVRARRWAPIVGLAGQPAWAYFAWSTAAWGLGLLVLAYTCVYLWGIRKQWEPK